MRRLFTKIPNPEGKKVIWIHAVSVGETKAAQRLFQKLRTSHPNFFFLITTTTVAGLDEARRSLPYADAYSFLPVDLRCIVSRWAKKLNPSLFVLIESDLWPHLLSAIKRYGGKIALVSGKLSERSAKRFARFSFLSKHLFSQIDLISAQNEEHHQRFVRLASTSILCIGGNLKFDLRPQMVDCLFWKEKISLQRPAITLACTHAEEEKMLLKLLPLEKVFVFLAPRHPERFDEVANILQREGISFVRWSQLHERQGHESVLLIDAMGQLPICYSLSRLAIVGGSFRHKIGGHNILEPCLYGVPVFFGPFMFSQNELVHLILQAKAGGQITDRTLRDTVDTFFMNPLQEQSMRNAASSLASSCGGATDLSLQMLYRICANEKVWE